MPTSTGDAVAEQLLADQRTAEVAKNAALPTYIALLIADTGTSDDVTALAAAAETLGKTGQEIQADTAAVKKAKALVATLNALAGADMTRAVLAALVADYFAKVDEEINRLDAQRHQLLALQGVANGTRQAWETAVKNLNELRAKFPGLLGAIQAPAPAILNQAGVSPAVHVPGLSDFLADYVELRPAPIPLTDTVKLSDAAETYGG